MQNPKYDFLPNPSNPLQALELAVADILIIDGKFHDEIRRANENYVDTAAIMGEQNQADTLHQQYVMSVMVLEQLVANANHLGRLAGSQEDPLELVRRPLSNALKAST
ncbi:MAG: hypothetical protein ACPG1C_12350 [Alphaproteobacteria bacterium]